MTKATRIYDAVDGFGLITSAQAAELGMSNAELVQQAHMGRFARVARGVYRVSVWPPQPEAPYAIAVKAVGDEALLYGESVVALLDLAPTDTSTIWVATPKRVRRTIDISAGATLSGEAAPTGTRMVQSREIATISAENTQPGESEPASTKMVRLKEAPAVDTGNTRSGETALANVKIIRSGEIDPVSIKGIPCQPIADAIISASTTMGINRAREALVEAMHRGYITRVERADTERGFARQRKRAARVAARGRQSKQLARQRPARRVGR